MSKISMFFVLFLTSLKLGASELPKLPELKLSNQGITTSGLSSGAFMAIQLQVIHSDIFAGAASFAGGIFGCAEGDVNKARNLCMQKPHEIDVEKYINSAKKLEKNKKIAQLQNLNQKPVYIFAGTKDSVVRLEGAYRIKEFMDYFSANTIIKTDLASEHGFPTLNQGQKCDKMGEPWIQNCQFDGAGELLKALYGNLKKPTKDASDVNILSFNQKEFSSLTNFLYDEGYMYVPSNCRQAENRQCRLHIAFHGCVQGPEYSQDIFPKTAGYNRWAEENDIVILYPSAKTGGLNLKGCWDWFGYSGKNYLTNEGAQIKALMKMINRLVK